MKNFLKKEKKIFKITLSSFILIFLAITTITKADKVKKDPKDDSDTNSGLPAHTDTINQMHCGMKNETESLKSNQGENFDSSSVIISKLGLRKC